MESKGALRGRSNVYIPDLVTGVLSILLGGAVALHARGFPTLAGGYPGPGLFPELMGLLMVGLGISLTVQGLRGGSDPEGAREAEEANLTGEALRRALPNAVAATVVVLLYMFLVERLGFIATMILLNLGFMLKLGVRPLTAILVSVAASIAVYYIFAGLLYVPLPSGPWR